MEAKSDFLTEEGGEETSFCERGQGAWAEDLVKWWLDAGKRWAGEEAAMASSGGSLVGSPSSRAVEAAAARGGWLVAVWASRRLSARVARSSSLKEAKPVMAAQTGSGRCRNQRAKSTSILAEAPAVLGGRRQRDLISVRALDGRWSQSGWFDKSRTSWTPLSADGENFFSRNGSRSWYSIVSSPFALSQVDICRKSVSGMAARTWSAWVWEDVTFFSLNWTLAWRNHMAVLTVENVGNLKWKAPAGEAVAVESVSAGMAKARESNSGVTSGGDGLHEEKASS